MESKSSYGNSQLKGLESEIKVIKYLENFGWKVLFQRLKAPYGEIDLVFEKEGIVLLTEVKSLSNQWRVFERISNSQLRKLKLNFIFFSNKYPQEEFKLLVAWVMKEKIKFIEIN